MEWDQTNLLNPQTLLFSALLVILLVSLIQSMTRHRHSSGRIRKRIHSHRERGARHDRRATESLPPPVPSEKAEDPLVIQIEDQK